MSAQGNPYLVQGRDAFHDRGAQQFGGCQTASQAAREYLHRYVEDWRGGFFEQIDLSLQVWRQDLPDQDPVSFSGSVLCRRDARGKTEVSYLVKEIMTQGVQSVQGSVE